MNITTTIIREYLDSEGNTTSEAEIEIEARYIRGHRATHTDPEEFPEVEIISAFIGNEEVELTEAEEEEARIEILNNPPH